LAFGLAWRQATWVTAGYLISQVITVIIRFWFVRRALGFPAAMYLRILWAPFAAASTMAVAVLGLRQALAAWPASAILSASVLAGAALYAGLIWLLAKEDVRYVVAGAMALLAERSSAVKKTA